MMSFLAFMPRYLWDITYYVTSFVRPRWCKTISATSLIGRCLCDVIFTMLLELKFHLCNGICVIWLVKFNFCNISNATSFLRRCFMWNQLCDVFFLSLFLSDVSMVVIGFVVVFFYVICLLGKFDKIENRVNSKFLLELLIISQWNQISCVCQREFI
jgi:hypothetical protein